MLNFTGWKHENIKRTRWVTGAVCTLLIYPVLIHYHLSSHFLPWLPAGVAAYASYGTLLSDKKFKVSPKTTSKIRLNAVCDIRKSTHGQNTV